MNGYLRGTLLAALPGIAIAGGGGGSSNPPGAPAPTVVGGLSPGLGQVIRHVSGAFAESS